MSNLKKILSVLLIICLLLAAAGCTNDPADPTEWFQHTSDSSQSSGNPAQTATQPSDSEAETPTLPSAESAISMFNTAVERFHNTRSYTMTGSASSTSIIGDIATTVVTSIDCRYETADDGSSRMLMNSALRFDGQVFEHSTYYTASGEDATYHISTLGTKYTVKTNDFGDFDGVMYLNTVDQSALSGIEIQSMSDGASVQVSFQIPYGVYASKALDGWFGGFVDDNIMEQPVTVRAVINGDGTFQSIYLAVETSSTFGEETIEQSVIASLQFSGYEATSVTAPSDLDTYEDRTAEEEFQQGDSGEVGILSPEDVS